MKGILSSIGILLALLLLAVCYSFQHESNYEVVLHEKTSEKEEVQCKNIADGDALVDEDIQVNFVYTQPYTNVLHRMSYVASYNQELLIPNWVAWHLTADHTDGDVARDNEFYEDFEVPSPRATNEDYRRSGWSRGHMCPAGDNKWDEKAMQESNLLTNICPQNSELNSGVWNVMPWGLVNDTSALESEINRLVYPLGSAAYMSEASLKNSMV